MGRLTVGCTITDKIRYLSGKISTGGEIGTDGTSPSQKVLLGSDQRFDASEFGNKENKQATLMIPLLAHGPAGLEVSRREDDMMLEHNVGRNTTTRGLGLRYSSTKWWIAQYGDYIYAIETSRYANITEAKKVARATHQLVHLHIGNLRNSSSVVITPL